MKYLALVCSLLLLFVGPACQEDPCASRICTNGGTCVDGDCDCPEGFIGPQCTVPLDPCLSKACIDASTATCVVGTDGKARCVCEDGFEGELCSDQWTAKFLGPYNATESCNGQGLGFSVNVLDGPEFKKFTIANFRNEATDSLTAKVVAVMIEADLFDIPEQFMHFGVVTGFGSYDIEGKINLTYEVINGKDTLVCITELAPN